MSPKPVYSLFIATAFFSHGVFAQDVPTFSVKPSNRPAAIFAPNALIPEAPKPLSPERMDKILSGLEGEPGGEQIVLDSKQPYIEDRAYLTLTLPAVMHPESSVFFDAAHDGVLGVKVNLDEGGRYLLDFAVTGKGSGNYSVMTESGTRELVDENAGLRHVLLGLNAKASGWTMVRLKRAGEGFHFYSVTVTRLN
jgi:hypothetical protein